MLAAEIQQALLERSDGNPLYAEQFAQLHLERGSADELPLPETLQGIIAARLDGLSDDEKAVLQDAAVMGKVFWTGALRRDETEGDAASALSRAQRLPHAASAAPRSRPRESGRSRTCSLRDVAYGQIPRAERAVKHGQAAQWIESLGRGDDHAELVAFHWNAALDLARAAGASTDDLVEHARIASRAAGDRGFALNAFPAASGQYERALALWPDDEERPELLFSLAHALFIAGDERTAEALERARDALVQSGRPEIAAEAEALLARMFWLRGQQDKVFSHLEAAEALIEGADASPGVAHVLAWSARHQTLDAHKERGLRSAEEALAMAEHFGLVDLQVHALTTIGSAKEFLSDVSGREDLNERSRIADADPDIITWRQGRCLAYGDGVTLWALAEIVKAQAGIAEQDDPSDVAEKLRRVAADALPEEDAAWVESHLLALAGLAEETELGGNRRNEAFSAWRRFLEGLAEQRPLVVVFEDLHWADESLLDFVDELVDWITDVPLLVVATARPELLERRPAWGGGKLNATTLALAPLTDEQTAQLLGSVLGTPVLAAETQTALIERAGGNPLYAEQFAELYVERGSTDELTLPETLQGIIAARLDGLSSDEKALMLDAAVVGKVFWTGALGRDEDDSSATFHALERKGFVRRQRRSSIEGQSELAFAHALVRDVAYSQIPRAERATKHRRVAEWIESLGRPEDHAEMLAYHWSSALEFVRASGGGEADLVEPCTVRAA